MIQDKTAIAYLGEVVPHSSYESLGITNALDILQVSPTDTALELTQATPAVANAPDAYYQSLSTYKQTFARVVPTTAQEAKAQVQEMKALGVTQAVRRLRRRGLRRGDRVRAQAGRRQRWAQGREQPGHRGWRLLRLGLAGRGREVLQRRGRLEPVGKAVRSLGARRPLVRLGAVAGGSEPVRLGARVPQGEPDSGREARSCRTFTSTYGHAPAVQAIFGYEAMAAVLSVLKEAGAAADNRTTVVKDFFSIKNRQSVLGEYSINSTGDTSIAPFVFTRLKGGQLVPVTFVSVQG